MPNQQIQYIGEARDFEVIVALGSLALMLLRNPLAFHMIVTREPMNAISTLMVLCVGNDEAELEKFQNSMANDFDREIDARIRHATRRGQKSLLTIMKALAANDPELLAKYEAADKTREAELAVQDLLDSFRHGR